MNHLHSKDKSMHGSSNLSQAILNIHSTNDVLCAQWEEALEQCWAEHILSHEKKEIQEFKSPGHLLKSLELMKNQYKEKPKTRLLSQIAKHLESLDNFAGMLATALALQSFGQGQIETTLLWGSLHLAIKVSPYHVSKTICFYC